MVQAAGQTGVNDLIKTGPESAQRLFPAADGDVSVDCLAAIHDKVKNKRADHTRQRTTAE